MHYLCSLLCSVESKQSSTSQCSGQAHRNAGFSLLLPGRILHLNALLAMKKFRDKGNKDGAVRGLQLLEDSGIGRLISRRPPRGTNMVQKFHHNHHFLIVLLFQLYTFEKSPLPSDAQEMAAFAEKLSPFGVSLKQYKTAMEMDDITM